MLDSFLYQIYFGNRILDYILALSIFFLGIIFTHIFRRIIITRLSLWADKTANTLDNFLLEQVKTFFLPLFYYGFFYLATRSLGLFPLLHKMISSMGIVFFTFISINFIFSFAAHILKNYWSHSNSDPARQANINGILIVIKVLVWGIGTIFLLDNLGFKVSSVIAGLGIGGVAVALAAQTILGDLFSYFAIFFDRPFEVGDFIIVGDYLGTIEHIGIKTTRIRSLGGEQIVFSNSDLTGSRVRNYKRMDQRRVVFKLGLTYQTNLEKIKKAPKIIEEIIKSTKETFFDRAHFFSYGDFSLVIEVVYYVLNRDYNKYMDIQQQINFAIKEEFEKQGIEFAYPTQTVIVHKD